MLATLNGFQCLNSDHMFVVYMTYDVYSEFIIVYHNQKITNPFLFFSPNNYRIELIYLNIFIEIWKKKTYVISMVIWKKKKLNNRRKRKKNAQNNPLVSGQSEMVFFLFTQIMIATIKKWNNFSSHSIRNYHFFYQFTINTLHCPLNHFIE